MIPPNIERGHVLRAIERIEAEGFPGQRTSKHWAVEHSGKRYPPKLVVSLAAEIATGQPLLTSELSSGGPGGARSLLQRLGFSVVALADASDEDDEDDEGGLSKTEITRKLEGWYPNKDTRTVCLSLLANAICWSHELGPTRWVCATHGQGKFNLTVGRVLVLSLKKDLVEVFLAGGALDEEKREQLRQRARLGKWEFKSIEGTELYIVPASSLAELLPVIEPAFREQLARAVTTVNQMTPFARNYEGLILDAVEGLLGRSLPRPLYATAAPAPVSTVDWALVQQALERFRGDAGERFRVALRRLRAGQLRVLLSNPEDVDADTFDREVWPMEARTLLRGQDITGQIFRGAEPTPEETAAIWSRAIDEGAFELHGNYVWGSGSRIFGPTLQDSERTQHVRAALEILNDSARSPLEKAAQIEEIPGFGFNIATGLVMLFHPGSFFLWNKVSRGLLPSLGYKAGDLEAFERSAAELHARLGTEDALELDWFFYLLSSGRYREVFPGEVTSEASPSRRILKIAPGENGAYWKDCLGQGLMLIGWDEVGDLRQYADAAAFRKAFGEKFAESYRNNKSTMGRLANELWAVRSLRPGDVILANRGKSEILAVGEVIDPGYEYLPERPSFKHAVHVKWDTTKARKIPSQEGWMRTIVTMNKAELAALLGPDISSPDRSSGTDKTIKIEAPTLTLAQILSAIDGEGLRLDDRTVRRYHVGLQVRGFMILAGVSGTGKTWLTRAYANAIKARYLLVAVAPNWTSNEDLLGYFNPLSKLYIDTAVSRFLREAAAEFRLATEEHRPPRPFHLVLDEMNLARVEHYFAKFLSALEVRQRDTEAELELHAGETVVLPPNLSFIGTVNVDETTHGFSDKVYDRAQLLELPAPRELLAQHVADQACGKLVMDLWGAVSPVAPFAFRVLDDIVDYIQRSDELGVDWKEALDEQVVQKILPKLKGTDPRIGAALEGVLGLTEGQLPLSHERARRMLEGFRQHGFASFF